MKAQIISIGNELLIGQVVNTNASYIGQALAAIGWEVERVLCVGDKHENIQEALDQAFSSCDYVLTTGGLGPTRDDITKKALSDYWQREMVFHEDTWESIQSMFKARKYPISDAHREQCYMPAGADVLENALGTAPGLHLFEESKHVFVLPGVPYEMKYLLNTHVIPILKRLENTEVFRQHTFLTVGTGESVIADHIASFELALPEGAQLAYLPAIGRVRIRLSMNGGTQEAFEGLCADLRALLDTWLVVEGDLTLQQEVARLFDSLHLKLVLAESCTGGNVAASLVELPGASSYFLGSAVTYSYEHKKWVLGVKAETLESHGAVSEEVVREMVAGALDRLGGDVAAAVSGIAGPDGGTPDKPLGTTWIAVGNREKTIAHKILFNKDRSRNIEFSTITVLNLIRKFLIAEYLK